MTDKPKRGIPIDYIFAVRAMDLAMATYTALYAKYEREDGSLPDEAVEPLTDVLKEIADCYNQLQDILITDALTEAIARQRPPAQIFAPDDLNEATLDYYKRTVLRQTDD